LKVRFLPRSPTNPFTKHQLLLHSPLLLETLFFSVPSIVPTSRDMANKTRSLRGEHTAEIWRYWSARRSAPEPTHRTQTRPSGSGTCAGRSIAKGRTLDASHCARSGPCGIREKKTAPTLDEFCKNRIEQWPKAPFQKPAPKTWLEHDTLRAQHKNALAGRTPYSALFCHFFVLWTPE
jgi:hypothetical protein